MRPSIAALMKSIAHSRADIRGTKDVVYPTVKTEDQAEREMQHYHRDIHGSGSYQNCNRPLCRHAQKVLAPASCRGAMSSGSLADGEV